MTKAKGVEEARRMGKVYDELRRDYRNALAEADRAKANCQAALYALGELLDKPSDDTRQDAKRILAIQAWSKPTGRRPIPHIDDLMYFLSYANEVVDNPSNYKELDIQRLRVFLRRA